MKYNTKLALPTISDDMSAKDLIHQLETNSASQELVEVLFALLKRNTILNFKDTFLPFDSTVRLGSYLSSKYGTLEQEEAHGIYLDSQLKLIDDVLISKGSLSNAYVHPRDIFRNAIKLNCSRFVLVHNHPSGDVTPSTQDIKFIKRLVIASNFMGIPLLDAMVVGKNNYFSFAEEDILKPSQE